MRLAMVLIGLLATSAPAVVDAGGGGPIFADGFEDCCTVGGTVSGLAGPGLVLRLSAGAVSENRGIAADGPFAFATPLAAGVAWNVSVQTQPTSGPPCQLSNASGTIGSTPVTDVAVHCAASLQWDSGHWGELWQ